HTPISTDTILLGAYLDTNEFPRGEKNISPTLRSKPKAISQSRLALDASLAPTPLENSANTSIKNAAPRSPSPIPSFLNKLRSPLAVFDNLNQSIPRTGPKAIQAIEFNESNHESGTLKPLTFILINAAP